LVKPASIINKRDLLNLQVYLQMQIRQRNRSAFAGISLVAQTIKLSYIIELLETQTIRAVKIYLEKIGKETSKAAKKHLQGKRN